MSFCSLLQIALSLFLVFVVTLYPYAFSFPRSANEFLHYLFFLGWGRSHELDIVVNTLLFLPLGFSLTSILAETTRSAGVRVFATVCAASMGLSYVLEVLQLFLPHRFPSLVDVLANGSGGGAGFLCFHLRKNRNVRFNLFLYLVAAFVGAALLQRGTSLRNWDPTFPLLIGNEKTGTRPWEGDIHHLYIADKAISGREALQIVQHGNVSSLLTDSLLASYRFTKAGGHVDDEIGLLPDLRWQGKLPKLVTADWTFFGANRWLETDGSASILVERIRKSSRFTLGIVLRTRDTTQGGPARIVSLSTDLHVRNFTLGQRQNDLVFRFRTPVTAASNGGNAPFVVPGVFAHKNLQHLILTYNGAQFILYVDGVLHPAKFELSPGATIFSLFIDSPWLGSQFCKWLYYASICIPLGTFVMLITKAMSGQVVRRTLAVSGSVVFASASLESLLVVASGKSWNTESLLISIVITFGAIVLWAGHQALRRGSQAGLLPRPSFHGCRKT
jgi:glycopeptide antibiotics resistance protein